MKLGVNDSSEPPGPFHNLEDLQKLVENWLFEDETSQTQKKSGASILACNIVWRTNPGFLDGFLGSFFVDRTFWHFL